MTREEAKLLWPMIKAYGDGKIIEYRNTSRRDALWRPNEGLGFSTLNYEYRIKPESKLRPWEPEEIPVGALIRFKEKPEKRSLIVSSCDGNVHFQNQANIITWNMPSTAFEYQEYSEDGGRTWLPCGVEE